MQSSLATTTTGRPALPSMRRARTGHSVSQARIAAEAGRAAPAAPSRLVTTTPEAVRATPFRLATTTAAAAAALVLLSSTAPAAHAAAGDKLGEFAASGLLFKDSVEVSALSDRDLPGVTVYVSDFKRSLTDKLAKDFFAEPSQASITCALDAALAAPLAAEPTNALEKRLGGSGGEGKEVFAQSKGLNVFKNKTLRIRRLFDGERRTAVFVAFSTRLGTAGDEGGALSTGRYRTSVCAVPLPAYVGAGGSVEQQVVAAE